MPNMNDDSVIDFHDTDWGIEEEPRSYLPAWITQYEPTSTGATFEIRNMSNLVSRELALAATRQCLDHGIDSIRPYMQRRRAMLAMERHGYSIPESAPEASGKQGDQQSRAELRRLEERIK